MAMSATRSAQGPMMEMNTTPLIDVLLVLLIMFIITIPVATHTVDVDLPQPVKETTIPPINSVKNSLILTQDGATLWNGKAITQASLIATLRQTAAMATEPELQFQPDANASYDLTAQTVNIIRASGVTKFGFVGNERYRQFGR